jgi:ferredoxin
MTRASSDMAARLDIIFVHSARTPSDIIFHHELTRMQATQPGLRVLNVCEGKGTDADWNGPLGRLDLQLLSEQVPDFREREVFTCGPKGYMDAVKDVLAKGGFDFQHYHQESFDIAALVEAPLIELAPVVEQTAGLFTITLSRSGKTFDMPANQTVLAAAKKAGAIVPSSCSQGVCGTCKTAVLQGTVEMNHNGGIRQREIDKGLRLLCCSRPTSDPAIAAVVTSGVSHRLCSAAKSRDWHETCGSCWSCATAAKAVGQSPSSGRMCRYRCRRDLRRLPQVFCSVAKSRDWHEPCGSCWSCATAAKAVGQSPSSGRVCRYRCRRDLRRLPQVV